MPQAEVVLWTGISSLILVMLGIIGYLISTGFSGLRDQLKTIWDKIDAQHTQAETNALEIREINVRCAILHANHQRQGDGESR